MELLVGVFVMGLVAVAATQVLVQGAQYLRVNQVALDAQRSGLNLLSQMVAGLQTTQRSLIVADANGVTFPSPFRPDGTVQFDPTSQRLVWQKWICYYYDTVGLTVTLKEQPISPPTSSPTGPPAPATWASVAPLKVVATDISRFQIREITASPPLWGLEITAGSMTDSSRYGLELHSEVSPRN